MSKARVALLGLAAVGIAVIAVVALAAIQPRPNDGGTTIANDTDTADASSLVKVLSATSAFPFVERWVAQYNDHAADTVDVSYRDEIGKLDNSNLAIVGNATEEDLVYVPVGPQAVAIVYNIPGFPDVPSGLKLNSIVLSSIFNGSTTGWSNASITDLNPVLNLPDEEIVVVYDSSNSSSLALLEEYLGSKISWSNSSIGVSGPAELASTVRKTPYSIGYVDHSYAIQTKMTFAALANSGGTYIMPSIDSVGNAIETGMQAQNITDSPPPFVNASRFGNSSYPIAGLYYAAMAEDANNATTDFVRWLIDRSGGQQALSEVQYPSIYPENEELVNYANRSVGTEE